MRVTTFNVNSLHARAASFERFVATHDPDVVCLQETKLPDERFPVEAMKSLGFPHIAFTGQKSYNGVAMLSKHPIENPQLDFLDGEPHPDRRLVAGTVKGIRIYGLYCPNGTEVGSPRYHGKLAWYRRLRAEFDTHLDPTGPVLVTGDFNVTPTDNDTWDPFRSEGHLLSTKEERAVLEHLMEFGLTDAWRALNPFSVEFTHWDYQRRAFSLNQGIRIDHVLLTDCLMKRARAVAIHKDVRGWDTPSDHAPVSVDLDD